MCRCTCGNMKEISAHRLKEGEVKSCGCLRQKYLHSSHKKPLTHGQAGRPATKEYRAWAAMIQKCYNKNSPGFKYCGGKGITVDEGWRESFETFYTDMGTAPSKRHQLLRIDKSKPYGRANCVWGIRGLNLTVLLAMQEAKRFPGDVPNPERREPSK